MRLMKTVLMIIPFSIVALSFSFGSKAQVKQPSPTATPVVSPTPKTKDDEVIKIDTNLVTLTATVADKTDVTGPI